MPRPSTSCGGSSNLRRKSNAPLFARGVYDVWKKKISIRLTLEKNRPLDSCAQSEEIQQRPSSFCELTTQDHFRFSLPRPGGAKFSFLQKVKNSVYSPGKISVTSSSSTHLEQNTIQKQFICRHNITFHIGFHGRPSSSLSDHKHSHYKIIFFKVCLLMFFSRFCIEKYLPNRLNLIRRALDQSNNPRGFFHYVYLHLALYACKYC